MRVGRRSSRLRDVPLDRQHTLDPGDANVLCDSDSGFDDGSKRYAQVQAFQESLGISGMIVIHGTARGGVLVGLAERFGLRDWNRGKRGGF